MFSKLLKKWQSKSLLQKQLFFEAYLSLFQSWLLIKIFPFKKIIIYQGLITANNQNDILNYAKTDIDEISWSIQTAAKYTPFKSLCLVQALSAQKMLKKRKINGLLYLGVAKDDNNKKGLVAHAWVRCNKQIITGGNSIEKYSVLSSYSWI